MLASEYFCTLTPNLPALDLAPVTNAAKVTKVIQMEVQTIIHGTSNTRYNENHYQDHGTLIHSKLTEVQQQIQHSRTSMGTHDWVIMTS